MLKSIHSKGVEAVLTGSCGPKALNIFNAENIPVHTGQTGTVSEAVERFKKGIRTPAPVSRPGIGAGSGMGGGRGMGGGGGRCSSGGAGRKQ